MGGYADQHELVRGRIWIVLEHLKNLRRNSRRINRNLSLVQTAGHPQSLDDPKSGIAKHRLRAPAIEKTEMSSVENARLRIRERAGHETYADGAVSHVRDGSDDAPACGQERARALERPERFAKMLDHIEQQDEVEPAALKHGFQVKNSSVADDHPLGR